MSFKLRAFANLPLIAFADGLAMGAMSLVFDVQALTSGWAAFWLLFWTTSVAALIVGAVLALPMLWIAEGIAGPKLPILLLIGALAGPVPIFLLDGGGVFVAETIVVFAILGALSAFLWWLLVERHRPPDCFNA